MRDVEIIFFSICLLFTVAFLFYIITRKWSVIYLSKMIYWLYFLSLVTAILLAFFSFYLIKHPRGDTELGDTLFFCISLIYIISISVILIKFYIWKKLRITSFIMLILSIISFIFVFSSCFNSIEYYYIRVTYCGYLEYFFNSHIDYMRLGGWWLNDKFYIILILLISNMMFAASLLNFKMRKIQKDTVNGPEPLERERSRIDERAQ